MHDAILINLLAGVGCLALVALASAAALAVKKLRAANKALKSSRTGYKYSSAMADPAANNSQYTIPTERPHR